MNEIRVYSIPGSPYGRAVMVALEEKQAAYRLVPVAPGTFRAPEHLARHPFGRVPVLEHGDFRLYETQAILRYLDRALPGSTLTPPEPRAAARIDQLMNVNDCYLFQGVGNVIVFQRIVGPKLMGLKPDEAAIAAAMPKAHHVFAALAHELGEGSYSWRRVHESRRRPDRSAARLLRGDAGMGAAHGADSQSRALAGSHEWPSEHARHHLGTRIGDGAGELILRGAVWAHSPLERSDPAASAITFEDATRSSMSTYSSG